MARMPATNSWFQKALDAVRREAVVILPLVYAFLAVVPAGTEVKDWKVWGPLLIGFVLRQFVTTPAKEAEQREDAAFSEGVFFGRNVPGPPQG